MSTRDTQIESFLRNSSLKDFTRDKIPADASFRKYERISSEGKKYILMDAPPEKEDVKPFIKIGDILISFGFYAPKIIARSIPEGLLLLEDFGNEKFNSVISASPEREEELYTKATDILVNLYQKTSAQKLDVPEYSKIKLLEEANLFINWYLPLFKNFSENDIAKIKPEYEDLINKLSNGLNYPNDCLVLRDYHADNLMILENNKTLGLLDFQDALTGNTAYDLVSLLEDARRDVPADIQTKMINHYIKKNNFEKGKFLNDYYSLGAQRNLKILGIFARLKVRDGKDNYLKFIPRVKAYLIKDLEYRSLSPLKNFITKYL